MKKRIQNEKRRQVSKDSEEPETEEACSPEMLGFLQTAISMIEGRRVSREEIEELAVRQRSIDPWKKIRDIIAAFKKSFP